MVFFAMGLGACLKTTPQPIVPKPKSEPDFVAQIRAELPSILEQAEQYCTQARTETWRCYNDYQKERGSKPDTWYAAHDSPVFVASLLQNPHIRQFDIFCQEAKDLPSISSCRLAPLRFSEPSLPPECQAWKELMVDNPHNLRVFESLYQTCAEPWYRIRIQTPRSKGGLIKVDIKLWGDNPPPLPKEDPPSAQFDTFRGITGIFMEGDWLYWSNALGTLYRQHKERHRSQFLLEDCLFPISVDTWVYCQHPKEFTCMAYVLDAN